MLSSGNVRRSSFGVRGRWAAGITPRNLSWIIADHIAISERPGGYAPNHRKVRRQEEILWLKAQGFSRILSLLPSPHNLHVYDEFNMPWVHFAITTTEELRVGLGQIYNLLATWLKDGDKVLVHEEELSDQLIGIMAGFLLWAGFLPTGPEAITVTERLVSRKLNNAGRSVVAMIPNIAPPEAPIKVGHKGFS